MPAFQPPRQNPGAMVDGNSAGGLIRLILFSFRRLTKASLKTLVCRKTGEAEFKTPPGGIPAESGWTLFLLGTYEEHSIVSGQNIRVQE